MLLIVGILLLFGLVIRHKWRNGAAKKEEILRLVAVASEEEEKIAELQAFEEYSPPSHPPTQLEPQYYCAVCHCPTATRCSRCKAARYCSGKCQIIHWRQGHKDECIPAPASHASSKSGYDFETASENQFPVHLKNEVKIYPDASQEFNDSGSSSSSASRFFSSTELSESSFDASFISEVPELGTPIHPDKAPSVAITDHYVSADVPSPSLPVFSVNHKPRVSKIEKAPVTMTDIRLRSTITRDKRKGDGVSASEEFALGPTELRSSQSTSIGRTSLADDWKKLSQTSASKVTRSIRDLDNQQMLDVDMSSEFSKSLKIPPLDDIWKYDSRSAGNFQNLSMKTDSPRVVSSEADGVRSTSQDTRKSLKMSVQKFVQQFKAPKHSKTYSFDMAKDSSGTYSHKVMFPPKLFTQLYSCGDVELHPFGLVNCGNSCYANAVLQCLTFTRPIASYLLHGLHSKTCWKRDWCFLCKFEHLTRKGQATGSPSSPAELLSQIQLIGREEDAHEFLRNVVEKMQSICLEEAGASGSLAEHSTLVGLTFGGYLLSKIKCMKCLGRSEQRDRMMDLTVEIDGNICTLEDALTQFTTSETLGGDDKYKCSRCKSYEKAKKKLTVLEAPNVLTIVLKRFRSSNLEKLNKLIKFPEVLNLSPYMSGVNDKYPVYHLYAVVVHLGLMNTAHTGHYVSYVKDFQGDWFKIDDSRVSRVDLDTVLSAEAYILFYARHSPRGASSKRNMEAVSSSKKPNGKTKPNPSRNPGPTLPHQQVSGKHSHWVSPSDFTGSNWGFHSKNKNPIVDSSSSDSSSIFSTSDAGSYSTDSTKDSSAEDLSGYLFGPTWYNP